jgi:hypothetical protein
VLDTGATLSLVRSDIVPKSVKFNQDRIKLNGVGGMTIYTEGKVRAFMKYQTGKILVELHVVEHLPEPMLIGMDVLRRIATGIDIDKIR